MKCLCVKKTTLILNLVFDCAWMCSSDECGANFWHSVEASIICTIECKFALLRSIMAPDSICVAKFGNSGIDSRFSCANDDDLLLMRDFDGLLATAWAKSLRVENSGRHHKLGCSSIASVALLTLVMIFIRFVSSAWSFFASSLRRQVFAFLSCFLLDTVLQSNWVWELLCMQKTHMLKNEFQSKVPYSIELDFEILMCLPCIKLTRCLLVLMNVQDIVFLRMYKTHQKDFSKKGVYHLNQKRERVRRV